MGARKIRNNRDGETTVDPIIARNYNALKNRFFDRIRTKARALKAASRDEQFLELRTDKNIVEHLYEQYLKEEGIDPLLLNREEILVEANEIYYEVREEYRHGEQTDPEAIGEVATVFSRAIMDRTKQERLTEELLEDIYKKTHRAFLENGAYHLIPEPQTIYLGTLVTFRTQSINADIDFFRTMYGDEQMAIQAYQQHDEQRKKERSALLDAAELPKNRKVNKEQPDPAERVRRFQTVRDNLSFLSLLENTVHGIGGDLVTLVSFLPPVTETGSGQEEEPKKSAQEMMREMLPVRRALFAEWNQLFDHLMIQKPTIDEFRLVGSDDQKAAAARIDQRVRAVLAVILPLKRLEEAILSEIVENGTAPQDHLVQYGENLDQMRTLILELQFSAEALGL